MTVVRMEQPFKRVSEAKPIEKAPSARSDSLFDESEWRQDPDGNYTNAVTKQRATAEQIRGLKDAAKKLTENPELWQGGKGSWFDNDFFNWEDSGLGSKWAGKGGEIAKLPEVEQKKILEQLVFTEATSHGGWRGMSDIQKVLTLGGLVAGGFALAGAFAGGGGAAAATAGASGAGGTAAAGGAAAGTAAAGGGASTLAAVSTAGLPAASGFGGMAAAAMPMTAGAPIAAGMTYGGSAAAGGGLLSKIGAAGKKAVGWMEANPVMANIAGSAVAGVGDYLATSAAADDAAEAERGLLTHRRELVSNNYRGTDPGAQYRRASTPTGAQSPTERFGGFRYEYDRDQGKIVRVQDA